MTWGNQKWKGALANFNKRARVNKIEAKKKKEREKNLAIISRADPRAWIKKYFKADSE